MKRTKNLVLLGMIFLLLGVWSPASFAGHNRAPWDHTLPGPQRFRVLADFADEAVLDKETGLVWERSVGVSGGQVWVDALQECFQKSTGGRKGWRLPTIEELASLVEPTEEFPALPVDHPFLNVEVTSYWSSTTKAADTSLGWNVNLGTGAVSVGVKAAPNSSVAWWPWA